MIGLQSIISKLIQEHGLDKLNDGEYIRQDGSTAEDIIRDFESYKLSRLVGNLGELVYLFMLPESLYLLTNRESSWNMKIKDNSNKVDKMFHKLKQSSISTVLNIVPRFDTMEIHYNLYSMDFYIDSNVNLPTEGSGSLSFDLEGKTYVLNVKYLTYLNHKVIVLQYNEILNKIVDFIESNYKKVSS